MKSWCSCGDHRRRAAAAIVRRVELAALPGVVRRHHDVDAVRLAVDVLVDPVELDLELLGRERERAEHAHPAGVGHRGDDVAAVAEGEDGQVDPEHVAEARVRIGLLLLHGGRGAGGDVPSPTGSPASRTATARWTARGAARGDLVAGELPRQCSWIDSRSAVASSRGCDDGRRPAGPTARRGRRRPCSRTRRGAT